MFYAVTKESRQRIDTLLKSNIFELQSKTILMDPRGIALLGRPDETLSIAAVCLHDACKTASDVFTGLLYAYTALVWYRVDSPDAPQERISNFMTRYHADNAALRLYPLQEDIAGFVQSYIGISGKELGEFRKKQHISLASAIGSYLQQNSIDSDISDSILTLHSNTDWQYIIAYRNKWVHEQPPNFQGTGIVHDRKPKWELKNGQHTLGWGGGDVPEYDVDEFLPRLALAGHCAVHCLTTLCKIMEHKLASLGMTFTPKGYEISGRGSFQQPA